MTTAQMVYSDVPDAQQAIDYLVALRAFAKDSGKPIPTPPVERVDGAAPGELTSIEQNAD